MTVFRKIGQCVWHVMLPLFLGALIYVFVRESEARFVSILLSDALRGWVDRMSDVWLIQAAREYPWLVNHFSDALWAYALIAFVGIVWANGSRAVRLVWFALGAAVVVFCEVAQLLPDVGGTFDLLDLFALGLGVSGALFVFEIERLKE